MKTGDRIILSCNNTSFLLNHYYNFIVTFMRYYTNEDGEELTEILHDYTFYGTYFVKQAGKIEVDVTDLVKNIPFTTNNRFDEGGNGYTVNTDRVLFVTLRIVLTSGANYGVGKTVYNYMQYPNYSKVVNLPSVFENVVETVDWNEDKYFLIGYGFNDRRLMPRIPYLGRDDLGEYATNFPVWLHFFTDLGFIFNKQSLSIKSSNSTVYYNLLDKTVMDGMWIGDSSLFVKYDGLSTKDYSYDVLAVHSNHTSATYPYFKIEVCPADYYLIWMDRLGGMMSQPFNAKYSTYSEDLDKMYITNYFGERNLTDVDITPKWRLNSEWIPEELFPAYESLYVSPFIYLYDTRNRQRHNVIINGNFTEKKYSKGNKVIQLNIDVEEANKQQILY